VARDEQLCRTLVDVAPVEIHRSGKLHGQNCAVLGELPRALEVLPRVLAQPFIIWPVRLAGKPLFDHEGTPTALNSWLARNTRERANPDLLSSLREPCIFAITLGESRSTGRLSIATVGSRNEVTEY
jgi:hypothetical protein